MAFHNSVTDDDVPEEHFVKYLPKLEEGYASPGSIPACHGLSRNEKRIVKGVAVVCLAIVAADVSGTIAHHIGYRRELHQETLDVAVKADGFSGIAEGAGEHGRSILYLGACSITLYGGPRIDLGAPQLWDARPVTDVKDYAISVPELYGVPVVFQTADQLRAVSPTYLRRCD